MITSSAAVNNKQTKLTMKVSAYAVLPAEVRYDSRLSQAAKLLYAEITAAATFEGTCEEDLLYFAKYLNCEKRTVYRYISELVDGGHIIREKYKGERMLKVPTGFAKASLSSTNIVPEHDQEFHEEVLNFFEEFLGAYEKGLNISLEKKGMYYPIIAERLKNFSRSELMRAMTNRINFINSSDWHRDNLAAVSDIGLIIKDDQSVAKYLNMKVEAKDEVTLKPHKF